MADFKYGLFGCFGNIGICIITFLVPCYTFGNNAGAVGNNCILCAVIYFVPLVNIISATIIRGAIRDKRSIDGSAVSDFITILCCPFCALVQEARELAEPEPVSMSRPPPQENQDAGPPMESSMPRAGSRTADNPQE